MTDHQFGFKTKSLHAGSSPDPQTGSRTVPIYQSTAFVFENTEDAGDLFALRKFGNIYSRIGNPTVAALEEKVAALEGGIGAVATASGLSAQFLVFASIFILTLYTIIGLSTPVIGALVRYKIPALPFLFFSFFYLINLKVMPLRISQDKRISWIQKHL